VATAVLVAIRIVRTLQEVVTVTPNRREESVCKSRITISAVPVSSCNEVGGRRWSPKPVDPGAGSARS